MSRQTKLLSGDDYFKLTVVDQINRVCEAGSKGISETSSEEFINSVQILEDLVSILFGFNKMEYNIDSIIEDYEKETGEKVSLLDEAHLRFSECLKFCSLYQITPKLNQSIMSDKPGTIDYEHESDTFTSV